MTDENCRCPVCNSPLPIRKHRKRDRWSGDQVAFARRLRDTGLHLRAIARMYGTTTAAVNDVVKRAGGK